MSTDLAADALEARSAELVERYRRRLEEISSPLVADRALRGPCLAQADQVIRDCAHSLRTGQVGDDHPVPPAVTAGARLASRNLHPVESLRAAAVLFDVVLDGLADAVTRQPDGQRLLHLGCRALGSTVARHVQAASTSYDAFLFRKIKEVRAEELERLARDIHDQVGNVISLAARNLELHDAYRTRGRDDQAEQRLSAAAQLLGEGMRRTRTLISEMKLPQDSTPSISAALETFLSAMDARGTRVKVVMTGNEAWLPAAHRDELFLMLREALRNAFAHSRSEHIRVLIDVQPHAVRAVVEDEGVGFDVAAVDTLPTRHGLTSMRERAALLRGRLSVHSRPRGGTRVEWWIPLPKSACSHD